MDIKIEEKEIGPVIEVEYKTSMFKMPTMMGEGFRLIHKFLREKKVVVQEAPYARYVDFSWDEENKTSALVNFFKAFTRKWHFFVGFPCGEPLEVSGELQVKVFEKRKYITCKHFGPYPKVGETYKAMHKWSKDNGYEVESESMEFYLNDPGEVKKSELETLCLIPVKGDINVI